MRHATSGSAERCARSIAVAALVVLGGCAELPTRSEGPVEPVAAKRALGLLEITITGIGTPAMSASATRPAPLADGLLADLNPVSEQGRAGVKLSFSGRGTVKKGESGAPGSYRYFFVTFAVRNASSDDVAYTTPRQNLTFIAVSTPSTIPGTPIREILSFAGSPIDSVNAKDYIPTGAAYLGYDGISAVEPDVLQAFTEDEVAAITVPEGVIPFPYGFVTRHATATDTRTLAASPAADQYDGFVTFAFKAPQGDDAYTIRLMVLAVDDTETRVTQSVEEQDARSQEAFEKKVADLSATGVTLLTGGSYGGSVPARTLCGVRSAGTPDAPVKYVNGSC